MQPFVHSRSFDEEPFKWMVFVRFFLKSLLNTLDVLVPDASGKCIFIWIKARIFQVNDINIS